MKSGSTVHDEIRAQIGELETEDSSIESSLNTLRSQRDGLKDKRTELYTKLAEFYLPSLEAEAIKTSLTGARAEVQKLFEERKQRRNLINTQIEASTKKRTQLEELLAGKVKQLDETAAKKDEVVRQVREYLAQDADYTHKKATADQAQAGLNQDKARAEAFAQDSERKLPAYQADEFFDYLLNGPKTRPGFLGKVDALIARLTKSSNMETEIARLIEFEKQRGTYEFLTSMPAEIQERIQKQQTVLDDAVKELRAKETQAEKVYKLPEVIALGTKLAREREELRAQRAQVDKDYARLAQEREDLSKERDSGYYAKARALEQSALERLSITELRRNARATESTADDKIVEGIAKVDTELEENDQQMNAYRIKRTANTEKLTKAREVEEIFTRNDYNSSRSRFPEDFDTGSLMTGYILGQYSQRQIESQMESNHELKPVETYHRRSYESSNDDSGGSSWGSSGSSWGSSGGSSGGSSWGSSDSGGGFSSGGGDSGGSFSSGDSG